MIETTKKETEAALEIKTKNYANQVCEDKQKETAADLEEKAKTYARQVYDSEFPVISE